MLFLLPSSSALVIDPDDRRRQEPTDDDDEIAIGGPVVPRLVSQDEQREADHDREDHDHDVDPDRPAAVPLVFHCGPTMYSLFKVTGMLGDDLNGVLLSSRSPDDIVQ